MLFQPDVAWGQIEALLQAVINKEKREAANLEKPVGILGENDEKSKGL